MNKLADWNLTLPEWQENNEFNRQELEYRVVWIEKLSRSRIEQQQAIKGYCIWYIINHSYVQISSVCPEIQA